MFTYFIIGVIVQFIIIIERAVRFPEALASDEWGNWVTWAVFGVCMLINIVLWPLNIIMEIYNVYNETH